MTDARDTTEQPATLDVVRVRLGYPDLETFVTRFAPNVTRGGVFLASKAPRPVGDVFRFEVALVDGPTLLSGSGRVTWTRAFDPQQPRQPHGMGVQFIALDPGCQGMLEQLIESRERRARRASSMAPGATPRESPRARAGGAESPGEDADALLGASDASVDRALAYARALAARTTDPDAELASLLEGKDATPAPVSLEQALAGLSEFLRPRTRSGLFQIPPELLDREDEPR